MRPPRCFHQQTPKYNAGSYWGGFKARGQKSSHVGRQDAPLVKRVEFLLCKGLSQTEVEEAFEVAGQVSGPFSRWWGEPQETRVSAVDRELASDGVPHWGTV